MTYQRIALKKLATLIKDGTHGTHKNVENGPYLLSAQNIESGNIIINENDRKISNKDFNAIHRSYKLQNDDILITIVGSLGRCAILKNYNGNFTFQRSVAIIRFDKTKIIPKFAYYQIQTNAFQKELSKRESKGAQGGVYLGELAKIQMLVPNLATQQKITQILDQIENLIESFTDRIEKEELTKNAIAKKVFNHITENDFQNIQLEDVSEIYQPKTLSPKEIRRGDYPVFGANGIIGFHNQYNHEKRQVTISCRGANCGKINYTPEKCWITGNSMVINTDNNNNIDKLFLYYYLSNSNLSCLISGSGIPQITRAATQKYKITLPSVEKQKEISSLLKTQSDLINNLRKTQIQYRQIKKYLLNHLISGDFDLTNIKLENGKEQQ